MRFSYDDIQKVAEPDHVLHIVAPNMPEGQRRHLFWGEFSEDRMVESRLRREKIVPPVHWRVTVGDDHRDGFWDGPGPEIN
jgi:hypothetical protein